jgi:hypothetical protein
MVPYFVGKWPAFSSRIAGHDNRPRYYKGGAGWCQKTLRDASVSDCLGVFDSPPFIQSADHDKN